ncbi:hypothetical protein BofuT4_P081750.1 [Botrytis cinerea T4]|uniref:Uncharacterized protein n=1 Tax=Botryotinia fuckeliana (strain T4) TaxID=999810 RepID=G2YK68_BOTF4|nr:hypothetical protein BofuT4_P081750.1 [Botrytis cinerea T4]
MTALELLLIAQQPPPNYQTASTSRSLLSATSHTRQASILTRDDAFDTWTLLE